MQSMPFFVICDGKLLDKTVIAYYNGHEVINMSLFQSEIVTVTRIHTISNYKNTDSIKRSYNVCLPTYELIYNVSGNSIVHFGNKDLDNVQNAVRYLPKGVSTGEYNVFMKEPTECIDIYFDTDDPMPESALILKNMTELKQLFSKAYNVWQSKKTGYYAECMSILYDIIKKIKLHGEKYSTTEKSAKIQPSYEYMLENYTDPDFDYNAMCLCSGLSYSYFKELFINRYGMSPVRCVTNLRIEKAKELLITGHYTVTEVSERCGFDSVYYFSKVFKSCTGITPKQYRPNDNKPNTEKII